MIGKRSIDFVKIDQLIKSTLSLFESLLVGLTLSGSISNQMETQWHIKSALETVPFVTCVKKNQKLLYLPKNAAELLLTYMQKHLKKPQGLRVCITVIHSMELSGKINCITCEHLGPKLNKSLDDAKLCTMMLCMVPQH